MKKWKFIFIVAVMSIFLTSCIDEESTKTNINEEMIQGDILKENKTKFLEKTVSMMGEGGWLYYLTEIKTVSGENTDITYEFDGIQMWEEIVENCYAPVIGEDGSIVDKISPRVPTLYYLEGAKEEVENIQECLNENQDKKTLFLELEKLKLTWISSEKLQELYEKLQKTVYQEEMGRYGEISYTDKITVPLKNKEKLSFTYLLDFGNIEAVNIEIISKDGQSYSALCDKGKLSKKQSEVWEVLEKIEKNIIKTQKMDVSKFENQLSSNVYEALKSIVEEIEENNNVT